MAMTERATVVAVFVERAAAEHAIDDLRGAGFSDDQIGYVVRDTQGTPGAAPTTGPAPTIQRGATPPDQRGDAASKEAWGASTRDSGQSIRVGTLAGEGAATGAVTGGVVGGLLGAAAALLIPGFGPVLAGGILATVLGGAALGAAAGGLLGALMGMGVPEEEARYYQGEFESGRTIVTVSAPGRQQEALDILHRNGSYNAATRA